MSSNNFVQLVGGGGGSSDDEEEEDEKAGGGGGGIGGFVNDVGSGVSNAVSNPGSTVADFTGADEFRKSETARELRRDIEEDREEGGVRGALGAFDTVTRAGFDFALDNPNASIQDTARGGIELATGVESDEQGEAAADLADDVSGGVESTIEGTPLDNRGTDLVAKGIDALVADPAKAAVRGTTGISIDEGDEEGTVGAVDAADVGITVGTAGAGKAGFTAARGLARGSDEALRGANEGLGGLSGADESGGIVDELAGFGRTSDEAASGADEAGAADGTPELVAAGEDASAFGARGANEAAGAADESGGLADAFGLSDNFAGAGDEAAEAAARSGDEAAQGVDESASLFDRVADTFRRGGDEAAETAARSGDEAAQGADEAGGILSRVPTGGRATQFGVAAGAGAVAAGAITDQFLRDSYQMADGTRLVKRDTLQPSGDREGGVMFEVLDGGETLGYAVIVGQTGRNLIMLDSSGNETRAPIDKEAFAEAQRGGRK